jgi:hypothetical protein
MQTFSGMEEQKIVKDNKISIPNLLHEKLFGSADSCSDGV